MLAHIIFLLALSPFSLGATIPTVPNLLKGSNDGSSHHQILFLVNDEATDKIESISIKNNSPNVMLADTPDGSDEKNLLELVTSQEVLSTFAVLLVERDTLVTALTAKNANLTVLAPDNQAFKGIHYPPPDEAITNILLYHIVSPATTMEQLFDGQLLDTAYSPEALDGKPQKIRVTIEKDYGSVRLNKYSRITETNIIASNGVAHVISNLIMPPPNALNIIAHNPFTFAVFLLALKRVEIDDIIRSTHSLTIFCPTNQAFKDLGWPRLRYLFSEEGKQSLEDIVLYHLSPKLSYSSDLFDGDHQLPTMLKDKTIKTSPKKGDDETLTDIEINDESYVVELDNLANNGVIHAIDKILVPFDWQNIDERVHVWDRMPDLTSVFEVEQIIDSL
ncbi:hypothetical protein BATDEDRAFT_91430 [Batrachochytrium dendrobatidis JAM81]|uniref:FAS1 domain-containing protein n=2 Tax=Batrachochytrium dendrobatidis TaxID=109871 RepID=F4PAZ1_BATDJ|eukprot:XP_006681782.1 hypothetical protein BATDEDRAFT_91430 [Batrachochytrium dendrobatidis JAM81]